MPSLGLQALLAPASATPVPSPAPSVNGTHTQASLNCRMTVQEIHHPMCFPPRFQLLGSPSEVYTAVSPKHVSLTGLCNEHLTHLFSTFLHLSISITRAEVACLFPVCI